MNGLSLKKILAILKENSLLKEYIQDNVWTFDPKLSQPLTFQKLSYNSNDVTADTLFFCKGLTFKKDYLVQAVANGVKVYVAETPYEDIDAIGIIVTDIKKTLAKIARTFYDFPEKKMTTIGITGTKGKTSTLYFIYNILKTAYPNQVAMTSSEQTTLDGTTYTHSVNSTPESLDLFAMMAEAANNGMKFFIMEVSSQAYKVSRVFGLKFDYGIFLNISPDHISPIEHPTFDDYFYCKRQLLKNASHVILDHDSDYFPLLLQMATTYADDVTIYGQSGKDEDFSFTPDVLNDKMTVTAKNALFATFAQPYNVSMPGIFNMSNATAALAVSALLSVPATDVAQGLSQTHIPGRMVEYDMPNGGVAIVDYAHNYFSIEQLIKYVKELYPTREIGLVVGASGDKAFSRRKDFGTVINDYVQYPYLTSDDPTGYDPQAIIDEIRSYITKDLPIVENVDRKQIILQAASQTDSSRVLLIVGKGAETTQKQGGYSEPYDGDGPIVEQAMAKMNSAK